MDLHLGGHGDPLAAARDEVGWFYAAAGGAMGLHGQNIEGGGSRAWDSIWDDVWDVQRMRTMDRAHRARRTVARHADVEREARVRDTLGQLDPTLRHDIEAVYVPFGASRTTWQAYCVFTKQKRPLLLLALRTTQMAHAYARKKRLELAETFPMTDMLRWVEDEVAHLDRKKILPGKALPKDHRLSPALFEATRREEVAVTVYDLLRQQRLAERRSQSAELLESKLAETRARAERTKARLAALRRTG